MEDIFWYIISLLPLICFVLLYRFMFDEDQIFGFFKKILNSTQNEFSKTQGWKGANDFY